MEWPRDVSGLQVEQETGISNASQHKKPVDRYTSTGKENERTTMASFIRNPKDFWSGAIFIGFGLMAVLIGRDYSMGTAGRMGPGYFPTILGSLLAIVGAIAIIRSLLKYGEAISRINPQGLALVLGATVLFGILIRGVGLPAAIIVMVMVSGFASIKFKARPFLIVAIGMALFCSLVFVKGLGLPMPIIGSWIGY